MAADMACELRKYNVSVVSLWPGVVRTELFSDIVNSADIELTGYVRYSFHFQKREFYLCFIILRK